MATREVPSMMMSFLDLLLSALGGVALLVVIFAAIQSNNATAAGKLPKGEFLRLEVFDDPTPEYRIGKEIGVLLKNTKGEVRHIFEDPGSVGSNFVVRWPAEPRTSYAAKVQTDPSEEITVGLWLRDVSPPPGSDAAGQIAKLAAIAKNPAAAIKVRVFWLANGRDSPKTKTFSLSMTNGFTQEQDVPR